MIDIHCSNCGGFISDPSRIAHRMPSTLMHKTFGTSPTSALCACTPPVVYGPPGWRSPSAGWRHLN